MTLTQDLENLLDRRPGVFGVYSRNLTTGDTVAVNGDRVFPAESAIKTAILLHYERCVDAGALDPQRRLPLAPERRFDGTGVLRYLADGLAPTLDDLAWLMIIVSDNTATAMLVEALGGAPQINATTAALGCPTAQLNEFITLERALAGESFS